MYVWHCAQLNGQATKNKKIKKPAKRHVHMKMDRFNCNGWLRITVNNDDTSILRVWLTHHQCHQPYTDISIPKSIKDIITEMKDSSAVKVSLGILFMTSY
jgi:hypothetical protein